MHLDDVNLRLIECVVNVKVGLIICPRCHMAVPRQYLRRHLASNHHISRSLTWLDHALEPYSITPLNQLEMYLEEVGEALVEPVQGLPIRDGMKCSQCPYYGVTRDIMNKHYKTKHPECSRDMVPCKVQTLFGGTFKKYFGVKVTDKSRVEHDMSSITSAWHSYQQGVIVDEESNTARLMITAVIPDDFDLLDPFIVQSRWYNLIDGHQVDSLLRLGSTPAPQDVLSRVVKMGLVYVQGIMEPLETGNVLIRRWILSTG
jgi:Orsellinic acid/F9775 biosynthesis cluster protein D